MNKIKLIHPKSKQYQFSKYVLVLNSDPDCWFTMVDKMTDANCSSPFPVHWERWTYRCLERGDELWSREVVG